MINYFDITPEKIDLIKDLWISNRDYHIEIEPHFAYQYEGLTFEGRMLSLFNETSKEYKITIAQQDDKLIGYSISEFQNNEGEILSLHVLAKFRGQGIGKTLLAEHVGWLKAKGCLKVGLFVSHENRSAIGFYLANGFLSNLIYMQTK